MGSAASNFVNLSSKQKKSAIVIQSWFRNGRAFNVFQAAREGKKDLVRLYLDQGASIDFQNKHGWTALMEASFNGKEDVVCLLLDRAANPDLQNKDGYTALMQATYNGEKDVVRLLLDRSANPDLKDKHGDGNTALMHAVYLGEEDLVHLLLNRGANTNLQNRHGFTALMEAAYYGYDSICKILVLHRADLTVKSHNAETALARAKQSGHSDVAAFLAKEMGSEEEAMYLAAGRFHPVYVCERKIFLSLPRLIKCEAAIDRGMVRELLPSDLNKQIAFGSHRWLRGNLTPNPAGTQKLIMERARAFMLQQHPGYADNEAPIEPHPDDYENPKLKGFQKALQCDELIDAELVWIDYLCIPQDNPSAQLLAINSLPYTVSICSDFVVLYNENTGIKSVNHQNLDEGSWEVYNARGWCRLECLSASASGEQIKKWKCSFSNGAVSLERLEFAGVSSFNPYEGEFFCTSDKRRIALMVFKLGACLADTYIKSDDLASLMQNAFDHMPNQEMKKRYKEDMKRYSQVQTDFQC